VSLALVIVVGGLGFFQQASFSQKTNAAIRQFSGIVAETRALYLDAPFQPVLAGSSPPAGSEIGPVLIASGAVPAGLAGPGTLDGKATSLNNPWGGATEVYVLRVGNDHFIVIITGNVPVAACARIIAGNVDPMAPLFTIATTAAADGAGSTGVWDMTTGGMTRSFRNFSASQAGAACNVGTDAYNLNHSAATGAYTGPAVARPASVGLWMAFRLN
jgi:hypothetical protein